MVGQLKDNNLSDNELHYQWNVQWLTAYVWLLFDLLVSNNPLVFSDMLMDILSSDILSLAYDSLPCKNEVQRWLFFISMLTFADIYAINTLNR